MTIKQPPERVQSELFPDLLPDKAISANGEARTRYGAVVQEAACAILGLTEIPNTGTHDCVFDAALKSRNTFIEIKSLRRKNKLPIYDWRRRKDKEAGVPLLYVIAVHDVKGAATMGGLWNMMADSLDTILVLPAAEIDRLAEAETLRQIGSEKTASGERNGYQRAGYREGYRNIPYEKLYKPVIETLQVSYVERWVRGLEFHTSVYFHREVVPWL